MYSDGRKLKNTIRKTKKYKSRRELRNDHRVRSAVSRWRSGLGEETSEEETEFVQDKYYVPDHFPSRDIATEMAGYAGLGDNKLLKFSLLAVAGLVFFKLVIAK